MTPELNELLLAADEIAVYKHLMTNTCDGDCDDCGACESFDRLSDAAKAVEKSPA